jgi:hypothetical protein
MFNASICLYGSPLSGFGFFADVDDQNVHVGDGSLYAPVLSYAIRDAARALSLKVPGSTIVAVFDPGGELFAKVELSKIVGAYPMDHLKWEPAPQIVIKIA